MQSDAQGIQNMLITSIIHDYGVEKKKQLKKDIYSTRHLSLPIKTNYKHVYPILALMLTSSLELLLMNIIEF